MHFLDNCKVAIFNKFYKKLIQIQVEYDKKLDFTTKLIIVLAISKDQFYLLLIAYLCLFNYCLCLTYITYFDG